MRLTTTRRVARRAGAALLIVLAGACASGGAGSGAGGAERPGAQPTGRGPLRREDRVVLTEFDLVTGVAVSPRMAFMATPQGLGIYDRAFSAWLPPLTVADGFPQEKITLMAADPVQDAVWIGVPGAIIFYRPEIDVVIRTAIPGIVDQIMFDRRDPGSAAFVRASGQWSRVTSNGFVTMVQFGDLPPNAYRYVPPTLADLERQFPSLTSFAGLLTRDAQMRSYPISAGARAPDRTEVWLGTWGDGMFQVDPDFNTSTHLPFGLLDRGAGALALAADGIWVGGIGVSQSGRGGVTFVSDNLQTWRWLLGPISSPLNGVRVNRMAVQGTIAWLATDRGLARMDTRNDADFRLWNQLQGLSGDRALSVLTRPGSVWVGTDRGLDLVLDTATRRSPTRPEIARQLLTGIPVHALLATGDTLWIGSDIGLAFLPPGATTPVRAAAASSDARLRHPITAFARIDSLVYVADSTGLMQFNLRTGRLDTGFPAVGLALLGGITSLEIDDQTLWVGGLKGLVVIDRRTGASRFLAAPGDLPGPVYDIRLTRDYAWVATSDGLVRLRRINGGFLP